MGEFDERLKGDEEKLREAVGIFRTRANLHGSSSDEALIRYAHEGGKGKPHASMVRECWHDFEMGRRYADLRVEPYVIKYQQQEELFTEPPPHKDSDRHEDTPESDASGATVASPGADAGVFSCPHTDMILDETGKENVCADCGELLGPADSEPISSQESQPESDANQPTSDQEGADSSKQPVSSNDEEVLF